MQNYSMYARIFKYVRNQKKMSQLILAKRLGVSKGTVYKTETGQLTPSMYVLRALERVAGMSLEDLIVKSIL